MSSNNKIDFISEINSIKVNQVSMVGVIIGLVNDLALSAKSLTKPMMPSTTYLI